MWFDSGLHDLTLPALPRPNYANEVDEKYYEPVSVRQMAEKYFDWVGSVCAGKGSKFVSDCRVFVLTEGFIVGDGLQLDVRIRGPGNTEVSWVWEGGMSPKVPD